MGVQSNAFGKRKKPSSTEEEKTDHPLFVEKPHGFIGFAEGEQRKINN